MCVSSATTIRQGHVSTITTEERRIREGYGKEEVSSEKIQNISFHWIVFGFFFLFKDKLRRSRNQSIASRDKESFVFSGGRHPKNRKNQIGRMK